MTDSSYKVAVGPDTFMVNYKFVNEEGQLTGESLPDHIVDQLDSWQKAARKEHTSVPTSLTFSYQVKDETVNQSLFIRPSGSSLWPWMLYSDDVKVYFAPATLNKGLFCQVRFSSHLLWMIGPETAVVQAESLLSAYLGRPMFHEQASEIHLCVDIAGFDFSCLALVGEQLPFVSRVTTIKDRPVPPTEEEQECGLTPEGIKNLEGKIAEQIQEECFHLASLTTTYRKISTIDFGSHASPISAQIYNKSLEIKKHKKEWFEPIWTSYGWDGKSPVWRVEFRFKRAFLRDYELSEAFSTLSCIPALWKYATLEWLRFVDVDGARGLNVSRLPTHPVWELVQHAYDNLDPLALRDPVGEEKVRLQLLLDEQPLQVLQHAVSLSHETGLPLTSEQQAQVVNEFYAIADSLGSEPEEVVCDLARDQFSSLTLTQQSQILADLSPEPISQVQAALIKRERHMSRLTGCIAGGIGYMRAAVALMPLDELPGYLGPNVEAGRQFPDLLSSFIWFAQKARDYDHKKGRVHVEEVLKKRLAAGLLTAQQLDEEMGLYGVTLSLEDNAAIDQALDALKRRVK